MQDLNRHIPFNLAKQIQYDIIFLKLLQISAVITTVTIDVLIQKGFIS